MAPSKHSPPPSEPTLSSSPVDVKHPHLVLRPASIPERHYTWVINNTSWRGILSENAYYLREAHLASQDLTRNNGIIYWVLVDPGAPCGDECPQSPAHILSACETIRKPSLIVRRDGTVEEVISYGIGSVYTSSQHRGKGYARSMLQMLGHQIKSVPDPDPKNSNLRVGFSVLYSDIGKQFYARVGWHPHNSSHISFPTKLPSSINTSTATSRVKLIQKADLRALCAADCAYIRRVVTKTPFGKDVKARCVQLPTVEVMDWHHAREEFVGQYATGRTPKVKGAWAGLTNSAQDPPAEDSEGQDGVWMIWTHDFAENKLVILRIHIPTVTNENKTSIHEALQQIVAAAALDAEEWGFKELIAWNADDATMAAVESVYGKEEDGGFDLVHREMDSIASLMWYDREEGSEEVEPEGIEWLFNEKVGWC